MIERYLTDEHQELITPKLRTFVRKVPGRPAEYFLARNSTAPYTFRSDLPPGLQVVNGRIERAPVLQVEAEKVVRIQQMVPELVGGMSFENFLAEYQAEGSNLTENDLCMDILNEGTESLDGDSDDLDEIIMAGIVAIATPLGLL